MRRSPRSQVGGALRGVLLLDQHHGRANGAAYETLTYEKQDRIGVVTLNKPEYLNGIVPGMGLEITDVFHEMGRDDDVLVTVFTGAGRAFSAGAFIRDPNTHSTSDAG